MSLLDQPRLRLGTLPTPLQPAPRLSAAIGVEVWFKRDDLTGFGLGGNKVRGLEFLLADARARGCDHLVTGGGPGSNWAMLAALGARTLGMDTVLVCYGQPVPAVGNMALAAQNVMKARGRDKILVGGVDAMPPAIEAVIDGRMYATVRNPSCRIHGGAVVAGVAAVLTGEKTGDGGIPKHVITDGPVVTKANAPGMLWMQRHFLI